MSKKNRCFEHESKRTWYYVLSALFLILFAPPAYAEIENFQAADVVLGQSNFTARTSGTTQNNLNNPRGISTDGQKLFVVDQTNHRVLIWNSIPTTNNVPADVVIGQPNFTSGTADQGGAAGANTLDLPTSVFSDGRRLFIADRNNSRVLIYNSIPSTNNASADVVVGQPDFTTTAGATNQTTMSGPAGVFSDGKRLFVADRQNRRVLIYNSIPTANGAAADIVIGQPDFTTSSAGTTREKMNFPFGVFFDGQRLFVADTTNHRVLIFNSVPATNGAPADVVIGQPDFTTGSSGAARNKMNQPLAVSSDGKRLLVSDFTNNRVLVYKSIPTSNNTLPDLVLGQPDFT
ncbi:MAG: NHL repeat-containing protein, partial [Candidatus Omnitrophica bacterium]|nr:NHL repeat-containing protein [Candidatus Omnitrophota bacterium]